MNISGKIQSGLQSFRSAACTGFQSVQPNQIYQSCVPDNRFHNALMIDPKGYLDNSASAKSLPDQLSRTRFPGLPGIY